LGFTLTADVVKAVVAGVAGFLAAAGLTAAGVACAPVVLGGIVVGFAVGVGLDYSFPTPEIVQAMNRAYEGLLERGGSYLYEIERSIYRLCGVPQF
jgi:hypothetical protein